MNISGLVLSTGLSILFLAFVFRPLEKIFPAKEQKFFRPEWWTDLFFLLGQYLLWSGLVFSALYVCRGWLHAIVPESFRMGVAAQPWWLQAVEVIVLSDFLIYWGHRLQHKVGFLWRFHAIHHSAEHLDWLAAHREHPVDSIYTIGLINLPAFILGFPLETLAGFIAFRGIWAIYIHSNVRLPIGPLRIIIGAPELHHWHHDKARDAGNYANISPLMDILFGPIAAQIMSLRPLAFMSPFPGAIWDRCCIPFAGKSARNNGVYFRLHPVTEGTHLAFNAGQRADPHQARHRPAHRAHCVCH